MRHTVQYFFLERNVKIGVPRLLFRNCYCDCNLQFVRALLAAESAAFGFKAMMPHDRACVGQPCFDNPVHYPGAFEPSLSFP